MAGVESGSSYGGMSFVEMYSYATYGTNGGSLPAKKRLQVKENVAWTAGSTYTYAYDGMGRPVGVTEQSQGAVVTGATYGPAS